MTQNSVVPAVGGPPGPVSVLSSAWSAVGAIVLALAALAQTAGYSQNPGSAANPLDATNGIRSFAALGVIREIKRSEQALVIRHAAIPGFMPKMTMEFTVRDTNEFRGLAVGDLVAFRVRATEQESWVEQLHRTEAGASVSTPAPADPATASLISAAQLKQGDPFPDAELLSEDGRPVKFSGFKGAALAFTLIFTRCPLPDFCPRMNQGFRRAREILMERTGAPTNWQFLSISFDPEFDKPDVLNRYAYSYRGKNADRWLFAAAPIHVTTGAMSRIDFRVADDGGSLLHNLRTVVLDPQGRVFRQFDGNKWKAEELADALAEAARLTGPP